MAQERLFGSPDEDLELVARHLEELLGPGEPHESLYFGGDYYRWHARGFEIVLQRNRELDEELVEPDHPEFPLLVQVSSEADAGYWDSVARGLGLIWIT